MSDATPIENPPQDSPPAPRRRICLVIAGFPPFVGGGERHAHLLGREWVRQGHEVTVLTRRMQADWPAEEEMDGMRICRVAPAGPNSWGKYAMIPAAALWLWRNRRAFDLVYICAFRVLGWLGAWSRLLGMRTWMRAEACGEWSGEFIWNGAGRKKSNLLLKILSWPYIALRNLCTRNVDAFISIGPDIRRELESGPFRPKRILDIPNGMDFDVFSSLDAGERQEVRTESGWGGEAFVWAYSGKLIQGKGLEDLLEAWGKVREAEPKARLLLIGSGEGQPLSCETELREIVRQKGWEDQVRFTGYVTDVARELSAADAFVFPSHRESFGLSPVEAMACGLPVVATRSGGVEAFLEDGMTGLLVPVADSAALANAMLQLMHHPDEAERLARAGRERVHQRYAIDTIARRHLDHLEDFTTKSTKNTKQLLFSL